MEQVRSNLFGKALLNVLHVKEKVSSMEDDKINHPKHYNNSPAHCSQCGYKIECIDITRHMDFNVGNIIKYLWRAEDKNGLEDLKKAQWYLNDLINYTINQMRNNDGRNSVKNP